MGLPEDDAVHKVPHKMKIHLKYWLKILVLVELKSSIELNIKG